MEPLLDLGSVVANAIDHCLSGLDPASRREHAARLRDELTRALTHGPISGDVVRHTQIRAELAAAFERVLATHTAEEGR